MRRNLPAFPGRGLLADLRSHGYFYYSLLLCCYSAMFATTVFFVPYYVELGYSNSRIGIIMAANSAMASVFPPLLGLLSDKLRSKRKTLLFCLAGLGLTALCVPVVGKQFLLTLLIAEEEPRGLELAIDELRQSFARVLELRAIVGISHPFTSFCRCHAASREAVDAQRFAGESGIYHISQIAAESGTAQTDLGALLAPLDNLLRSGSREELEKQLVQSFGASSGTAESDSVTLQVLALAQRVLHTAVSPGEAAALLRRCRIPEPLFSISPPQELQRRVTALCLAARDLLAERRRDGVSLLCAQAMETIEKQYMEEDLSLSGVSEQLHVSPNYLSANMKKYAGDTFMNLLIKKRMEVAHALLTTSSLKIYEVARQCGYSDQHYFSFCFKKYYGVSPAQLRRAESERGGDGA